MITNRRKFTIKLYLYGMSSFNFYRWNQFKVFPLAVPYVPRKTYIPKFSATFVVRYCVSKPTVRRSAGAAWRPIYGKKQTELETEHK